MKNIDNLNLGFSCYLITDEGKGLFIVKREIKNLTKKEKKRKIRYDKLMVAYECCSCHSVWREPSTKYRVATGRDFQCISPECDSIYVQWTNFDSWLKSK